MGGPQDGRSVSWEVEGWPDHGARDSDPCPGGAYFAPHSEFYANTFLKDFRANNSALGSEDLLARVVEETKSRGLRLYADLMEPMFEYAGDGQARTRDVPGLSQVMQIDVVGRVADEPCLNHPAYRSWLWAVVDDHCANYEIDGIMWCNERRSPLDAALAGLAPHCFCSHCVGLAQREGLTIERARQGLEALWGFAVRAREGAEFTDGAAVEFLRTLYEHPEILAWERFWVERNKALDRELYGIVKRHGRELEFGLNVWNRNHLNPWRKAQWPWREQGQWADWVKPILYQHQTGSVMRAETPGGDGDCRAGS